jgi:hypothetical protein
MVEPLSLPGQVRVNGALELEVLLLKMHGETRKELQAAGGLGIGEQSVAALPDHATGGDIMDQTNHLGGIYEIAEMIG